MASNVKESTTNALNLLVLSDWCHVNEVLHDISPRWKMVVLHLIAQGTAQFSHLKRTFPTLSDHVLGQRLTELVAAGLIERAELAATVPLQVRYTATSKGRALLVIIDELQQWGQHDWSTPAASPG